MTKRPTLTVPEAVEAFDIERRTLQRLLAGGKLAGAYKNGRGHWKIPIESLQAAGMQARKTWFDSATSDATDDATKSSKVASQYVNLNKINSSDVVSDATDDATDLRSHISLLQIQLDAEKEKNEQLRDNLSDMRRAMLMLESGQNRLNAESTSPSQAETRRRWWRRN